MYHGNKKNASEESVMHQQKILESKENAYC